MFQIEKEIEDEKKHKNKKRIAGIVHVDSHCVADRVCGEKESTNEKKLTIVTTLFPDYDFARQIAGDKAEVKLLLSPGVEAHDYDPSPADIISINKADLFIYTGEYMELWVPGILSSLESDKVTVVDASENISLIKSADEEHHEEDGHSHEYDPHIWTSPKNAIIMVNNILKAIEKKILQIKNITRRMQKNTSAR